MFWKPLLGLYSCSFWKVCLGFQSNMQHINLLYKLYQVLLITLFFADVCLQCFKYWSLFSLALFSSVTMSGRWPASILSQASPHKTIASLSSTNNPLPKCRRMRRWIGHWTPWLRRPTTPAARTTLRTPTVQQEDPQDLPKKSTTLGRDPTPSGGIPAPQ